MDAEVRDRLRLTTGRLAKRLGIDPPADPDLARNPDLARVYELQTQAVVFPPSARDASR
jgi:hypothetical protein